MSARREPGGRLSFETLFCGVPAFAGSLSFLLLFPSVSPASGPSPPPIGAGQILQEVQPVQPRTSPPSSVFPPVRITGSRIVPAPVLEKAASPWEGKTLRDGDPLRGPGVSDHGGAPPRQRLRGRSGNLPEFALLRRVGGDLRGRASLLRGTGSGRAVAGAVGLERLDRDLHPDGSGADRGGVGLVGPGLVPGGEELLRGLGSGGILEKEGFSELRRLRNGLRQQGEKDGEAEGKRKSAPS